MSELWQRIGPVATAIDRGIYLKWDRLAGLPQHLAILHYKYDLDAIIKLIAPHVKTSIALKEPTEADSSHQTIGVSISNDDVLFELPNTFFMPGVAESANANRLLAVCVLIGKMCSLRRSLTGRFTLHLMDHGYGADVGFCCANESLFLVPDSEFLMTGGHIDFKIDVERQYKSWGERTPKLIWRGSTTGAQRRIEAAHIEDSWYKITQRTEMCYIIKSSDLKEDTDVGISNIIQIADAHIIDMISRNLTKNYVPRNEQINNKFYIDIDGNTNAWAGLMQALIMGGCILKVASEHGFRQWYYDQLEPYVNFIPVKADLSDLCEQISWCFAHDKECEDIAGRSNNLAHNLSYDRVVEDVSVGLIDRFCK